MTNKKQKMCIECGGSGLDPRVPAEDNKSCPNCMGNSSEETESVIPEEEVPLEEAVEEVPVGETPVEEEV